MHAEVSTALRYLGQYYFKNKLYDEASLCAQRCCDYNDVRFFRSLCDVIYTEVFLTGFQLIRICKDHVKIFFSP